MNNLSEAAGIYGSFRAHVSTIIMSIICVLVIFFSIKTLINNMNYVETQATVKSASCKKNKHSDSNGNTNIMYKCNLELSYQDKNNTGNVKTNSMSSNKYDKGDIITIGYNKNNPQDVLLNFKLRKWGPIAAIFFMLLITSFSFVNLYYVRKYKSVARVEGVTGFISNVVRR
jgi:uncharacterized membrane protein